MSRSTTGKVKLDVARLERAEAKLMRRLHKMQDKVFTIKKMKEGLIAALNTAEATAALKGV